MWSLIVAADSSLPKKQQVPFQFDVGAMDAASDKVAAIFLRPEAHQRADALIQEFNPTGRLPWLSVRAAADGARRVVAPDGERGRREGRVRQLDLAPVARDELHRKLTDSARTHVGRTSSPGSSESSAATKRLTSGRPREPQLRELLSSWRVLH